MTKRTVDMTAMKHRFAIGISVGMILVATGPGYASATTQPQEDVGSSPPSLSLADGDAMFSYDADLDQGRFRSCDTDTGRQPTESASRPGGVRGSLTTSEAAYDFNLSARSGRGWVRVASESSGTTQTLRGQVTATPQLEESGGANWGELDAELQEVLSQADPDNRISVSVQDLSGSFGGARVTAGVDDPYRSASVIKVPILVELLRLVECGEISLDETITVTEDDVVGGSGELKNREMPLDISIQYLANLMITVSDNTATNVLIDRVGFDGVNALMDMQNLDESQLGRKMMQPGNPETGEENYMTAEEAVTHLAASWETSIISGTRHVYLNTLKDQEGDYFFSRALPGVPVGHKTGGLTGGLPVTHDIGYILEPGREVALAVMTEGPRETAIPTAVELVRTVYRHITDEPADGTETAR